MAGGVVIVGGGQAGAQAAVSLRDGGYAEAVTLIGEEPGLPYQRPPLSKAYLLGKIGGDQMLLKAASVYADNAIAVIDGIAVDAIDRSAKHVSLSNGRTLDYDHLVLATGARQRVLEVPGAELDGIMLLRTLADADALMARIDGVRRAVVVGAGFIGLEFAAVARAKGIEVVIVEAAPRPMGRALSADMARFFEERHIGWGSSFLFGAGVSRFVGEGHVRAVELTDGVTIEADLVLVGIGVIPNDELAAKAGLETADGIVVDHFLQTSDPAIFAIGDCARHPNPYCDGGPARIESVQNATDQGRSVAARILGSDQRYDAIPWFWSDQGDLKLQIAGVGTGHDTTVVRGDPAAGAFSVFCFRGDRLLAVESVNRGPDHIMARRLIAAGAAITAAEAADEATPLKALLARAKA